MRRRAGEPAAANKPPEWFKRERYDWLRPTGDDRRDAAVWVQALMGCHALRDWDDDRWLEAATAIGIDLPPDGRPYTDVVIPAYIARPPVAEIALPELANAAADPAYAYFGPALFLSVSLNAPDEIIVEGFKQLLQATRKAHPGLVSLPGPKALNSRATAAVFERWRSARIVEVAELEWWRRRQPEPDRPKALQIARWIFGENIDHPNRKIAEARTRLAQAIGAVPALWAQSLKTSN
ncbi:MAG TPA: hypothetical protein VGS12_07230 [Caulobacteraceae bacterium]|nr:hypothetical protein [Caulobacteraceae bacterium]